QATQDLVQSLQQSNPGLRATGNPSRIRVNGLDARSVYLSGNSPLQNNDQPLAERDWLVTVPISNGGLAYLVFVAPEKDFNQLRSAYEKMLGSLQVR
ncbi:MAG TPA: hypothetical protein VKD65_02460, partial [Candidatus Angelobacter sp.]|nr:hypothetical protein [Candidatus Angelobacter sp.]